MSQTVATYLPVDVAHRIEVIASMRERTVSAIVRTLIGEALAARAEAGIDADVDHWLGTRTVAVTPLERFTCANGLTVDHCGSLRDAEGLCYTCGSLAGCGDDCRSLTTVEDVMRVRYQYLAAELGAPADGIVRDW